MGVYPYSCVVVMNVFSDNSAIECLAHSRDGKSFLAGSSRLYGNVWDGQVRLFQVEETDM